MKKIIYITLFVILFGLLNSCGYQPIYKSNNMNMKIVNYDIEGNQDLGQEIYTNLNNLFFGNDDAKEVNIVIISKRNTIVVLKDRSGKETKNKISLDVEVKVIDILSNKTLAVFNNTLSETYMVQDRISETNKLENDIISNLVDRITQLLMMKISQSGLMQ